MQDRRPLFTFVPELVQRFLDTFEITCRFVPLPQQPPQDESGDYEKKAVKHHHRVGAELAAEGKRFIGGIHKGVGEEYGNTDQGPQQDFPAFEKHDGLLLKVAVRHLTPRRPERDRRFGRYREARHLLEGFTGAPDLRFTINIDASADPCSECRRERKTY